MGARQKTDDRESIGAGKQIKGAQDRYLHDPEQWQQCASQKWNGSGERQQRVKLGVFHSIVTLKRYGRGV